MAEHQDHDTFPAGQNIPQTIHHGEPDVMPLEEGLGALNLSGEPRTRADFLQYSRKLTLDPNTANKNLMLSDGNRKAKVITSEQKSAIHPDKFTGCLQVLSSEILTGRRYWEVEWRGEGVEVAVVGSDAHNKNRKGSHNVSGFGQNDTSWAFRCNSYNYRHNKVQSPVPDPRFSRVGVYLDRKAGILSFYSIVSETMTLLHRVQTTFTQPLYAGLYLFGPVGDTAELCDLKKAKRIK